jgi:tetratricopeptide (TPR) repeat protein
MAKKKAAKKTSNPDPKPKKAATPRRKRAEPVSDRPAPRPSARPDVEGQVDPASTPAHQARRMIVEALDAADSDRRVALARKALQLWPDCAEAYLLLAEEAETRAESLELFRKAVEAGERVLGPELFEEQAGRFWLILETRPYMRARLGLAELLWGAGHREEAAAHLRELLRLNPTDNQGVRYILASWLFKLGHTDELTRLLAQHDEPSASWTYTQALLAFQQSGDSPEAKRALKRARSINKHVPAYLIGTKSFPPAPPPFYHLGGEDEAMLYAHAWLSDWRSTPGAIAWLKAGERAPRKKKPIEPEAQGPLPLGKKRLERLPQTRETWQADARPLGPRIESDGVLERPWLTLVASLADGAVVAQGLTDSPPSADRHWDLLADAMQTPLSGPPRRPRTIEVGRDGPWSELAAHLDEVGIQLKPSDSLALLEHLFHAVGEGLAEAAPPGLLESKGVGPDQVAEFYRAAAGFYRRAPWRLLDFEVAIRIECDLPGGSRPRYAVVMGHQGQTFGLTLYDDLKLLKQLWADPLSDEENADRTVALTVIYEDEGGLSDADLDAIAQYHWEVAGPDAYPSIFRKERGLSMRLPSAAELALMTAALRAIPDFVAHRPLDDFAAHEAIVPVLSGQARVTLAWVDA